jgi:hypothetical protein
MRVELIEHGTLGWAIASDRSDKKRNTFPVHLRDEGGGKMKGGDGYS